MRVFVMFVVNSVGHRCPHIHCLLDIVVGVLVLCYDYVCCLVAFLFVVYGGVCCCFGCCLCLRFLYAVLVCVFGLCI